MSLQERVQSSKKDTIFISKYRKSVEKLNYFPQRGVPPSPLNPGYGPGMDH
jgi:hypothetical protein